jgi:eukaryotic-like serine/threonine-protein kinase
MERSHARVEREVEDDVALVAVSGLVDEEFTGFGAVGTAKIVVIDVSGITRITSFGVRQWLKAIDTLPRTITDLYVLGCPTSFVDQLNMVLGFGGPARVLTVLAPYSCSSCGVESGELIDVLAERATLAKGDAPVRVCARCGGMLQFDEAPESYFGFASRYGASSIQPMAAEMLEARGLYRQVDHGAGKPARIIKLIYGSVTYFRITGAIGSTFRARPFLVGAEGEVVIDLAAVDQFDAEAHAEWRRLLKSLSAQVQAVTLVDINQLFLSSAVDALRIARNIAIASVLVPYSCVECGRTSQKSAPLQALDLPKTIEGRVCPTCGGATRSTLSIEALSVFRGVPSKIPPASAKVIEQRDEIVSRALTNAHVAQAREQAPAATADDDKLLGKYKIVRRLSAGGMAEVFLATQVGLGGFEKPVALKRIQRKLLDRRERAIDLFLNEAKIAGRLTHPNIVQVLDVGEVGGSLYLAMEYVHGRDLRDIVRRLRADDKRMPLAEVCLVMREVATALDHAYWSTDLVGNRLSVVHRDVSPHNIILGYDGAVKLLDFGVAMSAITEHGEKLIVGKWAYMAPETTMNGQSDHRSDLFSLGVVAYLLCTGKMPFSGAEPKEIVRRIRLGSFKPLAELAPEVPEELARLVGRLLAPNPSDRPQRAQDVVNELSEIVRRHRLESSRTKLAELVTKLLPSRTPAEHAVERLVRVDDEGDVHTATTRVTDPAALSSSSGSNKLADVSESYRPSQPGWRSKSDSIMWRAHPPTRPPVVVPDREIDERPRNMTLINVITVVGVLALLLLIIYFLESSY